MSDGKTKVIVNRGGCGCVSVVLAVLFFWALIFGVTISGKHYGVGCSCDRGVEVGGAP